MALSGESSSLPAKSSGEDAVEELAALAQLHHQVHALGVLAGLAEPHHGAACTLQRRHAPPDLHLPLHVLGVGGATQPLAAGGLAGQRLARGRVLAAARHPELPAPQLRAQPIPLGEALPAGRALVVVAQGRRALPPLGRPALLLAAVAAVGVAVGGQSAALATGMMAAAARLRASILEAAMTE